MTQQQLMTLNGTRTAVDGLADLLGQHAMLRGWVGETFEQTCSCGHWQAVGPDPITEWRRHVAEHIHRRIQTWPNSWQHQLLPSLAMPLTLISGLRDETATVNAVATLAARCLGAH